LVRLVSTAAAYQAKKFAYLATSKTLTTKPSSSFWKNEKENLSELEVQEMEM